MKSKVHSFIRDDLVITPARPLYKHGAPQSWAGVPGRHAGLLSDIALLPLSFFSGVSSEMERGALLLVRGRSYQGRRGGRSLIEMQLTPPLVCPPLGIHAVLLLLPPIFRGAPSLPLFLC